MFLAKVKRQGKEPVMSTNKDCRNAKTAEEKIIRWMTPMAILSLSCLLDFPIIDKLF